MTKMTPRGKPKRGRSLSPKAKKKEKEQERIARQGESSREYGLGRQQPQYRQEEKNRRKEAGEEKNRAPEQEQKKKLRAQLQENPTRTSSRSAEEKGEEQKEDIRVEELHRGLGKARRGRTRGIRNLMGERKEGRRTGKKPRGTRGPTTGTTQGTRNSDIAKKSREEHQRGAAATSTDEQFQGTAREQQTRQTARISAEIANRKISHPR